MCIHVQGELVVQAWWMQSQNAASQIGEGMGLTCSLVRMKFINFRFETGKTV